MRICKGLLSHKSVLTFHGFRTFDPMIQTTQESPASKAHATLAPHCIIIWCDSATFDVGKRPCAFVALARSVQNMIVIEINTDYEMTLSHVKDI